jgi:type I restriction enzyme S subunit
MPREKPLTVGAGRIFTGRQNWQRVKLGDLLAKTEEVERNPLAKGFSRYLMVEHLDARRLRIRRWGNITDGSVPPTFYKVFRNGQILYPTRNPHLRRTAVADFDGICGEKTLTLSIRNETDSRFIPFLFHSDVFVAFATKWMIGSTNPHIRWRDIAGFEFAIPPLDQQRRLADILCAANAVLEEWQEARDAAKASLVSMVEALTLSGIQKKRFQNTRLGRIPANWKCLSLGELTEECLQRNNDRMLSRLDVLSVSNKEGFIRSDDRIPETSDLKRYKIVRTTEFGYNPMRLNIGSIACLRDQKPGLVSPDYVAFRCKPELLMPEYLEYFRITNLGRRHINAAGQGSIRIRYYYSDIAEFQIPLPPLDEQREIVLLLNQYRGALIQAEEHLANSQGLLQSLADIIFQMK